MRLLLLTLSLCLSTLNLNAQLVFDVSTVDPFCANFGEISVTASGGSGSYTYAVVASGSAAPGASDYVASNVFTSLFSGLYDVYVFDVSTGETANQNDVLINGPDPLLLTNSLISDISCHGSDNGVIEITTQGGLPPYQVSLSSNNGLVSSQTTSLPKTLFTNLEAGEYFIMAVDSNNCTLEIDVVIDELPQIVMQTTIINNIACFGSQDGIVEVEATGGTGNYTYNISNLNQPSGVFQTSNVFNNLAQGVYEVTVQDDFGCFVISQIEIIGSEQIIIETSVGDILCNGASSGVVQTSFTGGLAPYQIALHDVTGFVVADLSTDLTEAVFTNLPAGDYFISVQDNFACIVQDNTVSVAEPAPLGLDVTSVFPSGNEASGDIVVSASGGTPNYSYAINGVASDSNAFKELSPGVYDIVVSDVRGCTSEPISVTIDALDVDNAVTQSLVDGLLALFQDAISYQWIDVDNQIRIPGATTSTFIPTYYGRYQLEMVIDITTTVSREGEVEKTLEETQTVLSPIILYNEGVLGAEDFLLESIAVYPNPTGGLLTVPTSVLDKNYTVFDITGKPVKQGIFAADNIDLSSFNNGLYLLKVEGYTMTKIIKE